MTLPDFHSEAFLRGHVAHTMAFYHPRAIDPDGGFFHYFLDDGSVYERSHRHLVSSARFVFNYAMAAVEFAGSPQADAYRDAAAHGVAFLRHRHRLDNGGYAWTLRDGRADDTTMHSYGLAFVLLAGACAQKAGLDTSAWMDETWQLLERHAWDPAHGLYRDEADTQWRYSAYRGQNANMHLCEAMIAAWEATHEQRYLDRALLLAQTMTQRQAAFADGLIWEHYDTDWRPDWNYHRDDPKHLFRPWGFQPGHQVEWSKLLLQLHAHLGDASAPAWLVTTARSLFDRALLHGWDAQHGGIVYGFAPTSLRDALSAQTHLDAGATADMYVCDDDKYFWVQAEAIAAAARLHAVTGDDTYAGWYGHLWAYAWTHFVDHEHGAWYRLLDRRNQRYGNEKSPAGKTDYHTMGACHDVLAVLRARPDQQLRQIA